jgi:Flp pilus assembly protein TadG
VDTAPARGRGRTSARHALRHGQRGQGLVEFAIVGPIAFLLLLGIIIVGITGANQDLLTNSVRDTARVAAVCGGLATRSTQGPGQTPANPVTQLPAVAALPVNTCSWANLNTWAGARLTQLIGGSTVTSPSASGHSNCANLANSDALVCLFDASNTAVPVTASNPLDLCQRGYKIEISSQYAQPLYVPLVSNLLGTGGTTSRTLSADAEATCEQ